MSQFWQGVTAGSLPPSVPTTFETQDGEAVPLANTLIIDAFDSSENDVDGITTKGGTDAGDPPGAGAANEVSIYLTNRITGTATTNDDVTPQTLSSFSLGGTAGTYLFNTKVVVYNLTDGLSATYSSSAGVTASGGAGTLTTVGNFFTDEIAPMDGIDVAISVTDVVNTFTIEVMGLAGKEIHYLALTDYLFVS